MKKYLFLLILNLPTILQAQTIVPVYILDGVVLNITSEELDQLISPNAIQQIDVISAKSAIETYGDLLGKNGLVIISSTTPKPNDIPEDLRLVYGDGKPLLLVQHAEQPYQYLENIDTHNIASVEVIKNDLSYLKKYGAKAINGVIKVMMK